jgi:hypothetical protein
MNLYNFLLLQRNLVTIIAQKTCGKTNIFLTKKKISDPRS